MLLTEGCELLLLGRELLLPRRGEVRRLTALPGLLGHPGLQASHVLLQLLHRLAQLLGLAGAVLLQVQQLPPLGGILLLQGGKLLLQGAAQGLLLGGQLLLQERKLHVLSSLLLLQGGELLLEAVPEVLHVAGLLLGGQEPVLCGLLLLEHGDLCALGGQGPRLRRRAALEFQPALRLQVRLGLLRGQLRLQLLQGLPEPRALGRPLALQLRKARARARLQLLQRVELLPDVLAELLVGGRLLPLHLSELLVLRGSLALEGAELLLQEAPQAFVSEALLALQRRQLLAVGGLQLLGLCKQFLEGGRDLVALGQLLAFEGLQLQRQRLLQGPVPRSLLLP
mmetsp:Transcript_14728/g.46343  ORF Transcript_14728/g.46343 Transcript_14728/m.46343 type:complete len:339 (+) Transcript_14728:668-1684(+)